MTTEADVEPLTDQPTSAPTLSSEVVFHGRVWDIRRDVFDAAGETVAREYTAHPGAVAILAQDADGRVLLIRQYRHPIRSRDWELPAGLLDVVGEDPLAAAQRELAEEADLVAADWMPLIEFATTPGGSDERIRIFRARDLTATSEAFARTAEEAEIELRWAPLDEIVAAALEGRIENAILIIAALTAHVRHD